jgi:hypothetical protein
MSLKRVFTRENYCLSFKEMMEDDGGHEANHGARSRARERAYSNNFYVLV